VLQHSSWGHCKKRLTNFIQTLGLISAHSKEIYNNIQDAFFIYLPKHTHAVFRCINTARWKYTEISAVFLIRKSAKCCLARLQWVSQEAITEIAGMKLYKAWCTRFFLIPFLWCGHEPWKWPPTTCSCHSDKWGVPALCFGQPYFLKNDGVSKSWEQIMSHLFCKVMLATTFHTLSVSVIYIYVNWDI